jgi:hypothetical protein
MFFKSLVAASALLYSTVTAQSQTACNNSPALCSRAYNNITQLGAHDSPFLRNKNTSFSTSGNHYYDTTTQLDAGVRLLSAQVHKNNNGTGADAWHLCHTSCTLFDAGTLEAWLSSIKTWMDKNTHDVVTVLIVNSDSASASDLGAQFNSSGISEYAYTPPSTSAPTTWPTLDALIGNNTRLISFVASLPQTSSQYPFLKDEFTYVFENDFENVNPSNYSCTPSRPTGLSTSSTGGRLFLMNHFLYDNQLFGIQQPNATYANTTNAQTGYGSLGSSVSNCTSVYGKAPWAVLVDFFNVGPAIASVDAANGVSGSISGRRSLSTDSVTEASEGSGARAQGSLLAVVIAVFVAVGFGL